MVQTPVRTRLVGTCPRCGSPLRITEAGVMVDQADPVAWRMVKRECTAGCLLVADDFAEGLS